MSQEKQPSLSSAPKPPSYSNATLLRMIWTQPRAVFRYINTQDYRHYFFVFLALAGISNALDRAVLRDMGDSYSLGTILMLCILVGGLLGWISIYIYAWLLSISGTWIKGKANHSEIYRVIAYALLPAILGILLYIPQIAVFGNGIFQSGPLENSGIAEMAIYWTTLVLELVLGIYTLVFMVSAVAEVQQFSLGRAILNLIMAVLVVVVPILILVGMVTAISA